MMNEHGDFQEPESSALREGEADPCGAAKESRLASASLERELQESEERSERRKHLWRAAERSRVKAEWKAERAWESRQAALRDLQEAEKNSVFTVFESPLARCLWSFASFASEHPVLLFGASLGLQILTLSAAFGLAGWVLGW